MKRLGLATLLAFAASSVACDSDNDDAGGDKATESGSNGSERQACLDSAKPLDLPDSPNPLMNAWGAECNTDADCVAVLGPGAVCDPMSVIYELPGNYCTKPCSLPDPATTIIYDAPECDPNGGVHCIGQTPLYQRCAVPCTDNAQCNRYGYTCRQMPSLSQPGDPSFCLMPDCCQGSCGS